MPKLSEADALKRLEANANEIKAWTEALGQLPASDSIAVKAICKHIEMLTDNHCRLLGLSENEITQINTEAEATVERELWQSMASTWRAIEANLPRVTVAQIKWHINQSRGHKAG
jgi:hypothetical protein